MSLFLRVVVAAQAIWVTEGAAVALEAELAAEALLAGERAASTAEAAQRPDIEQVNKKTGTDTEQSVSDSTVNTMDANEESRSMKNQELTFLAVTKQGHERSMLDKKAEKQIENNNQDKSPAQAAVEQSNEQEAAMEQSNQQQVDQTKTAAKQPVSENPKQPAIENPKQPAIETPPQQNPSRNNLLKTETQQKTQDHEEQDKGQENHPQVDKQGDQPRVEKQDTHPHPVDKHNENQQQNENSQQHTEHKKVHHYYQRQHPQYTFCQEHPVFCDEHPDFLERHPELVPEQSTRYARKFNDHPEVYLVGMGGFFFAIICTLLGIVLYGNSSVCHGCKEGRGSSEGGRASASPSSSRNSFSQNRNSFSQNRNSFSQNRNSFSNRNSAIIGTGRGSTGNFKAGRNVSAGMFPSAQGLPNPSRNSRTHKAPGAQLDRVQDHRAAKLNLLL